MSDILSGALAADRSATSNRLGPWLSAWHDPVADLTCNGGCMQFMDLSRNGDYKLVVACKSRQLKIYQGTSLFSELTLLEEPSGLCHFRGKGDDANGAPLIAVSAGPYIFIYRNLRPFYKFAMPLVEPAAEEEAIWKRFRENDVDAATLREVLTQARQCGARLGPLSTDFLGVVGAENSEAFLEDRGRSDPLSYATIITCVSTINKSSQEPAATINVVAGTEHGQIVFIDPPAKVIVSVQLPQGDVPAFLAPGGVFDAEWRVIVACREGRIYTVKNGEVARTGMLTGTLIELEAAPCGLARLETQIYVATTDEKIHVYHLKGKRVSTLKTPALVTQLEVLQARGITCILVALSNGEVRLYDEGRELLHTLQTREAIAGIRFGPYAREEGALAVVSVSGKLSIFMLHRKAELRKVFSKDGVSVAGPGDGDKSALRPPEQDIPLKVPKKTKLFVEQTQREKEQAGEIHDAFQKDLCRLRLTVAQAYVATITDAQHGVSAVGGGASLRLHAKCQGLGPHFMIKLEILNQGEQSHTNLLVALAFDRNIYRMENGQFVVSTLIPGVPYHQELSMTSIDAGGAAGAVNIAVLGPTGPTPLVSAVINMPLSELIDI